MRHAIVPRRWGIKEKKKEEMMGAVPTAAYGVVIFFLPPRGTRRRKFVDEFNGHGARAGNVFWLIPLSTATLEYTQQPNNCGSCPEQTTSLPVACPPKSSALSFRRLANARGRIFENSISLLMGSLIFQY